MKFTFVTLFPELIENYFTASILKRAKDRDLIEIETINIRDYSVSKHNRVDSSMVGGGAGMLLSPEPIGKALDSIKKSSLDSHIIFLSPVGKLFKQSDAKRLSKKKHIVLVSGRYEGMDERVIEIYGDEVFSIGDFILTGGELPSLTICDSISRLIPDVLGNQLSTVDESFENMLLEAPAFTKPNVFKQKALVSDYLKGDHGKISSLKKLMSLSKTNTFDQTYTKK